MDVNQPREQSEIVDCAEDKVISCDDFEMEMDAVCELFAGHRDAIEYKYLRQVAESPFQVPFHFLNLVRTDQNPNDAAGNHKPTLRQVEIAYRAILQRPPESIDILKEQVQLCPSRRALVVGLLTSEEATCRMPELHARAFPFAQRLWHVHIPKTAGSSFFTAAMESDWGFVNTNMLGGAVGNLKKVAMAIRPSASSHGKVIITGHWKLTQFVRWINPFDHLIAFVRDPVDRLISEFNFSVDVVNGGSNVHASPAAPFLNRGLVPESFAETYRNGFFEKNIQSGFLSTEATCEAALRNFATGNSELLPCEAVNSTINRYFPGVAKKRVNVSNQHIRTFDISSPLHETILIENIQDRLLNDIALLRFRDSAAGRPNKLTVQAAA